MKNNKGFTLLEMLIVVAIIAVLIAIAIPVFNGSIESARKSADEANIRIAYSKAMTDLLEDGLEGEALSDPLQSDGQEIDFLNTEQPIHTEKGKKVKITVNTEGIIEWDFA